MKQTIDRYKMLGLVSDEAEQTVLAAMLDNDEFAESLTEKLTPEHFHDPRCALVFEAVSSLVRQMDVISTDTVISESRRVAVERKSKAAGITPDFLASLTGNTSKALELAHRLDKLVWLRQAGDYAFWLTQRLQTNPEPDSLYAEAQEMWQRISPKKSTSGFTYAWDTMPAHMAQIDKRIEELKEGKPTFDWPWQSWNGLVRPLAPGMLGLLTAADGMGKTTYLEMVAEHWAKRQHHVVLVHLEDAPDYKYNRRLARFSDVPMADIEDGRLTKEQYESIKGAYYEIEPWAALFLHYYHAPGKSMAEIVRELEARIAEGICDCVVLDYIDKVATDKRQSGLYKGEGAVWERQADNVEILKNFAERNSLPVFSATQGNKSMQNGGTQTRQNIRGSGQKSEKSQLVVILSRDIVGDAGLRSLDGKLIATPGEYSPIVDVRIDKQNRGKTGQFKQWIVGSRFKILDVDTKK